MTDIRQESSLERERVREVIGVYGAAWVRRDPELIVSIFTQDATYHERVFKEPYRGHAEIKKYWQEKVVVGQSDIAFKLLNLYIDGSTAIAEWEATFLDRLQKIRKHMREVAILEFAGDKIRHLREYWASETVL